jgi:hypothetical protein
MVLGNDLSANISLMLMASQRFSKISGLSIAAKQDYRCKLMLSP